jgi:uncharacterized protein YbaR (Trm112 family)
MHIDLIETLRCPSPHAEGWLVAAAEYTESRRIVRGTLGCPVCQREWRIEGGVLWFDGDERAAPTSHVALLATSPQAPEGHAIEAGDADAGDAEAGDAEAGDAEAGDAEAGDAEAGDAEVGDAEAGKAAVGDPDARVSEALRTAALLDLREPHGHVLLAGDAARVSDALHVSTAVSVLAVNATSAIGAGHSVVHTLTPLRLGVGTLRGARVDLAHATPAWLDVLVAAITRGGRLVAPAQVPVPLGVEELARDDHEWVAEVRASASGLVPLRRGGDPMAR